MEKTNDERFNDTMRLITDKKWEIYFPGQLPTRVKSVIETELKNKNNWPIYKKHDLGELLSLGGIRIIKTDAKTKERHLIRLTLLIYRLLGCHSHHEALRFRETLRRQFYDDVLTTAKSVSSHALRYIDDKKSWSKEIAIQYAGRLEHYYMQDNDRRTKDVDFTSDGWCLGMVLEWLGCKAQKANFWKMHDSDIAPGKYRFNMAAQGARHAHGANGYADNRCSFRLRRFGLERTNNSVELLERGNPPAKRFASMITACKGTHCTILQVYKDGGAHAMAAYFENDSVGFLDPNLGEF